MKGTVRLEIFSPLVGSTSNSVVMIGASYYIR
jgi:hypothetical protein